MLPRQASEVFCTKTEIFVSLENTGAQPYLQYCAIKKDVLE